MSAAVAVLIFGVALAFILSERIHRTIIAIFGAGVMLLTGKALGFYNEELAIEAIEFNTLGLLLGMMILVALLGRTGFFEYLAIIAGQRSRGRPWTLLVFLGITTGLVSMFLDNVTTVILIFPVTLQIASLLRISPVPLLVGEALLSNVMGTATLVGDPPNILIGTAVGLSFTDFLVHLGPVALVAMGATILALRITFRRELAQEPQNVAALLKTKAEQSISDQQTLRRTLIVIGIVVLGFFFSEPLHLEPSTVALTGAGLGLLWVRPTVDEILKDVEWSVLLFFAGLFVLVGGLENASVLSSAAQALSGLATFHPAILSVALVWLAAILSSLVDNIPFTIAAIPIVESLTESVGSGDALWWALALGAGFGGNGTPIGSTAGVVAVTMSEKTDNPITFRTWVVSGTLATVTTALIASAALALFFEFFR